MLKYGASNIDNLRLVQQVLNSIIFDAVPFEPEPEEPEPGTAEEEPTQQPDEPTAETPRENTPEVPEELPVEEEPAVPLDPLAAAIESIMGEEGQISIKTSPIKASPIRAEAPKAPPQRFVAPIPITPVSKPIVNFLAGKPSIPKLGEGDQTPEKPSEPVKTPKSLPAEELNLKPIALPRPEPVILPPTLKTLRMLTIGSPESVLGLTRKKPKVASKPEPKPEPKVEPEIEAKVEQTELKSKPEAAIKSKQDSEISSNEEDDLNPVLGGIWNQDLLFVGGAKEEPKVSPPKKSGCKVLKPRYPGSSDSQKELKTMPPQPKKVKEGVESGSVNRKMGSAGWDVLLSESSDDDDSEQPKKVQILERDYVDQRVGLRDHDYCYEAYLFSQNEPKPKEDLSEMDKILSNVAMGEEPLDQSSVTEQPEKRKKKKKEKKKRKKMKRKRSSESEVDVGTDSKSTPLLPRGPKPKYHTPGAGGSGGGVTAGAARPHFSSSEDNEDSSDPETSSNELASSDYDTDFEADEIMAPPRQSQRLSTRPSSTSASALSPPEEDTSEAVKPKALKLKIKLPPKPVAAARVKPPAQRSSMSASKSSTKVKLKRLSLDARRPPTTPKSPFAATPMSKKMRDSLALNKPASDSSSEGEMEIDLKDDDEVFEPPRRHSLAVPSTQASVAATGAPEVPEKLYCYCQSPHDHVSEMIGCDAPGCKLEWFHFECVGIMIPPEGEWFCPDCSKKFKYL